MEFEIHIKSGWNHMIVSDEDSYMKLSTENYS